MEGNIRRAAGRSGRWTTAPRATVPSTRRAGTGVGKGLVRALVRAGSKSDHSPAVARIAVQDPTVCARCAAVFARKTWRRSLRRLRTAARHGAVRGICPACRQVASRRAYGLVRIEGSYVAVHSDELLRRIRNVAARAAYTQPERRVVEIVPRGSMLEVRTTSQKLAHRLARELAKAFRGTVSYHWSDRDGMLLAVWRRDDGRQGRPKRLR